MEMDELKNAWALVDKRLKENEMLNKRIIQGMLSDKSSKSLNKLVNIEMFSIFMLLPVIPLCIWFLSDPRLSFENFLFPKIMFVAGIVLSIFGIVWGGYTLKKYLLKIDFSKSVKDNMRHVNKYTIYYRKGKMLNYFFIIPVVSLLCILSYYELKTPFYLWIFLLVCLTTGIAITYWMYKKVYDANIQSIQKSLDEIRELKEE